VTGDRGTAEAEVLAAAADLVAAYGSHDTARYFAAFTPDATFVFHTTPGLISSRAQYEQLWADWERDGFRVLGCRSLNPRAQLVGDGAAVFTHRVRTELAGAEAEACERETMVFVHTDEGRWLAVHEHLSPDPESGDPDGAFS